MIRITLFGSRAEVTKLLRKAADDVELVGCHEVSVANNDVGDPILFRFDDDHEEEFPEPFAEVIDR